MRTVTITAWLMPLLGTTFYVAVNLMSGVFEAPGKRFAFGVIALGSVVGVIGIIWSRKKYQPVDERERILHFSATQAGFLAAVATWIPLSLAFPASTRALQLMMVIMWIVQQVTFQWLRGNPISR